MFDYFVAVLLCLDDVCDPLHAGDDCVDDAGVDGCEYDDSLSYGVFYPHLSVVAWLYHVMLVLESSSLFDVETQSF